jgi:hypothetical protein
MRCLQVRSSATFAAIPRAAIVYAAALVASGISFEVLAQNAATNGIKPASEQDRGSEVLAGELAAARVELDLLKARQALSAATWQERLVKETRAAESKAAEQRAKLEALTRDLTGSREEVERLRSRLSEVGAEVLRLSKALAEAANERASQALRIVEAQLAEQRARTDALAGDVVVIRQELATLKSALVRTGAGLDTDLPDQPLTTGSLPPPERSGASSRVSQANIRPQARAVFVPSVRGTSAEPNLIARADRLVRQGDIAGARLVLEHALRMSPQGSEGRRLIMSMLAETFDPNRLAAWGVYGVKGDLDKARELYAQAR